MNWKVRLFTTAGIASMLVAAAPAIGYAQSGGEPQAPSARARLTTRPGLEYRLLATKRSSTMQKELNVAAAEGFRFLAVMKGETGFAGDEIVSILVRDSAAPAARYEYRLLATSKTSTMQKELQEAGEVTVLEHDGSVNVASRSR